MTTFEQMMEAAKGGRHPVLVVEEASGPLGADRHDITSAEEKLAEFNKITGTIADYKGYVGPDWIAQIGEKLILGDAENRQNLMQLAQSNRDRYASEGANIDQGGNYNMWDNILRGILATRTDQVGPSS